MAANVVTGKCCGRNYFLDQITGVLPANPCDSICLTVASTGDLPDPATSCEFALVQDLDVGNQGLYEWDGGSWNVLAITIPTFADGDITEVAYSLTGSWSLTINGETPVANPYIMPADTSAMTVVFTNGACSYTMDEVVAPVVACSDYTLEWVLFDSGWGFAGSDGNINGVALNQSASNIVSGLNAFYSTFEGHVGVEAAYFDNSSGVFYIGLVRTSASDPFTTFGTYENNNDPGNLIPIDVQGNSNCLLNCYTTTFTMINIPVTEIEDVYVAGNHLSTFGLSLLLSDPVIKTTFSNYVNAFYGMIDPEWDMVISLVGDQATITFYSLFVYDEIQIKLDTGNNQNFTFDPCA